MSQKNKNANQKKMGKIKEIDIMCGICMEILVEPTSLNSCGHSYCVECITNYWHSSRNSNFSCPVCKTTTHICSVDDFKGSNIITQLIETINPKGYKARKEEYYEQKKMNTLLRKYVHSQNFTRFLPELEKYFNDSDTGSCSMRELTRVMRSKFPGVKNIQLELKVVLSSLFKERFITIHDENMIKADPRAISAYIQENIHIMKSNDVAELLKPFTHMSYEIPNSPSRLTTLLRNYQEKNLERIYKYILDEYGNQLNDEDSDDHEEPAASPSSLIRSLGQLSSEELEGLLNQAVRSN
jgi:hypothetical protein